MSFQIHLSNSIISSGRDGLWPHSRFANKDFCNFISILAKNPLNLLGDLWCKKRRNFAPRGNLGQKWPILRGDEISLNKDILYGALRSSYFARPSGYYSWQEQ